MVFTGLGLRADPGKIKKLYMSRMSDLNVTRKPVTSQSNNKSKGWEFSNCRGRRPALGEHVKEVLRPLRLTTSSWSQFHLSGGMRGMTPQEEEFPGLLKSGYWN